MRRVEALLLALDQQVVVAAGLGGQGGHLPVDEVLRIDRGSEVVVAGDERRQRPVGVHPLERGGVAGLAQHPQARAHP